MGLSASQVRLLTLTSRMSDLEFSAQRKSNDKQRLSVQSSQVASDYTKALDKNVIKFSATDTSGNTSEKTLTANVLAQCGLNYTNAQRLLVDNSGRVLVDETMAANFKNSNNDLTTFLNAYDAAPAETYPAGVTAADYQVAQDVVKADQENIDNNLQPTCDTFLAEMNAMKQQSGITDTTTTTTTTTTTINTKDTVNTPNPVNTAAASSTSGYVTNGVLAQNDVDNLINTWTKMMGGNTGSDSQIDFLYKQYNSYNDKNMVNSYVFGLQSNWDGGGRKQNGEYIVKDSDKITGLQTSLNNILTSLNSALSNATGNDATQYQESITQINNINAALNSIKKTEGLRTFNSENMNDSNLYKQVLIDGSSSIANIVKEVETIYSTNSASSTSGNSSSASGSGSTSGSAPNLPLPYEELLTFYNAAKAKLDAAETKLATDKATLASYTPKTTDKQNTGYYTRMFNEMSDNSYITASASNMGNADWLNDQLNNGNLTMKVYDSGISSSNNDDDSEGFKTEDWSSGDNCITQESDDTLVAKAKAKYDSAMAKINIKDSQLDLDMKNIDTEHSAIQTEYDSVKKVIDKNVERSFKMFS